MSPKDALDRALRSSEGELLLEFTSPTQLQLFRRKCFRVRKNVQKQNRGESPWDVLSLLERGNILRIVRAEAPRVLPSLPRKGGGNPPST